jgi:hypothetical protein
MPDLCGACGSQPISGSTTVTASKLGQETSDTVRINVPLCAKCVEPLKLVEKASDNAVMNFLGCFSGLAVVAMLVALFLAAFFEANGVWIAVFGIPAFIGVLVLKAMEYAMVRALPSDQKSIYDRAKPRNAKMMFETRGIYRYNLGKWPHNPEVERTETVNSAVPRAHRHSRWPPAELFQ